jgi:hypothetical protein
MGSVEMVLGDLSTFQHHSVRFRATHMTKVFFKRTMPFADQCGFVVADEFGEYQHCEDEAEFGLYFRKTNTRVMMVSLCQYHTIYQESIWVGENSLEG